MDGIGIDIGGIGIGGTGGMGGTFSRWFLLAVLTGLRVLDFEEWERVRGPRVGRSVFRGPEEEAGA